MLDKYGWLLLLVGSCVNSLVLRSEQKQLAREDPVLVSGLTRRIWGHFIFWSAPWWLMAIMIITGRVAGVSEFTSCNRNIPVLFFFTFTVAMVFGVGIWIWFLGGDKYLVRCKMFDGSAHKLKFHWALAFLGMVLIVLSGCLLFKPAA